MNTFEGNLVAENIKIGIVVARFNEFITSKLLAGALDNLKRENVGEYDRDNRLRNDSHNKCAYKSCDWRMLSNKVD